MVWCSSARFYLIIVKILNPISTEGRGGLICDGGVCATLQETWSLSALMPTVRSVPHTVVQVDITQLHSVAINKKFGEIIYLSLTFQAFRLKKIQRNNKSEAFFLLLFFLGGLCQFNAYTLH